MRITKKDVLKWSPALQLEIHVIKKVGKQW